MTRSTPGYTHQKETMLVYNYYLQGGLKHGAPADRCELQVAVHSDVWVQDDIVTAGVQTQVAQDDRCHRGEMPAGTVGARKPKVHTGMHSDSDVVTVRPGCCGVTLCDLTLQQQHSHSVKPARQACTWSYLMSDAIHLCRLPVCVTSLRVSPSLAATCTSTLMAPSGPCISAATA